MPKIKITERELEVYYETRGKGPPLFLITGFLGSIDFYWQALGPYLVTDFQVVMFDNRASGKTVDEGNPFTLEEMGEDLYALIDHFGFEKVHLFGHSMGSMVAQIVAHRYKGKIDKVILCNPLTKMSILPQMIFQSAMDLLLNGVSFPKVLRTLLPWMYSESFVTRHFDKLKSFSEQFTFDLGNGQRQCQALIQANTVNILSDIGQQTLVVGSKEDLLTPLSYAEEIREKIPCASLSIIPGGHASTIEQPKELSKLIREFLLQF